MKSSGFAAVKAARSWPVPPPMSTRSTSLLSCGSWLLAWGKPLSPMISFAKTSMDSSEELVESGKALA